MKTFLDESKHAAAGAAWAELVPELRTLRESRDKAKARGAAGFKEKKRLDAEIESLELEERKRLGDFETASRTLIAETGKILPALRQKAKELERSAMCMHGLADALMAAQQIKNGGAAVAKCILQAAGALAPDSGTTESSLRKAAEDITAAAIDLNQKIVRLHELTNGNSWAMRSALKHMQNAALRGSLPFFKV